MTEGPYKLPEGWRWVKLGEVAEIYSGSWGEDIKSSTPANRIVARVIRVSDITEQLKINYSTVPLRMLKRSEVKRYALKDGDLVVVKSSGSKAKVISGRAAIFQAPDDGIWIPSNFTFGVRVDRQKADPQFLWYWLNHKVVKNIIEEIVSTFTYPNLRKKDYQELPILLPPLQEQRRIVARIEELMARVREARRLRQEALRDAERLWQSVLAETFPRPGSALPAGWRWVKLGEVCYYERRSIDPQRHSEQVFYLYSIPAHDQGRKPEKLTGREIKSSKVLLTPPVCLFSKINPRIPRIWVVAESAKDGVQVASAEFMPLRARSDNLDLFYLGLLLGAEVFLSQVRSDVTGATGSRQRLRPEVVLKAFIPLPPLEEQRRIVARLEAIQEQIQALKAAQEETEYHLKDLEQAILDKAFRGEL